MTTSRYLLAAALLFAASVGLFHPASVTAATPGPVRPGASAKPAAIAKLAVGAPAPAFALQDVEGRPIALADFRGRKVLVSFYRYAACVFCNLRMHDVIERSAAWRAKGLAMVAFFESPPESIKAYVGKQAPPFPLIADPERLTYARYGVVETAKGPLVPLARSLELARGTALGLRYQHPEGERALLPADFLIGPDGRIHEAYYGRDIGDHLPFDHIDRFLAEPATPTR